MLIQSIAFTSDVVGSLWGVVGYTVLLVFTLFKTGSLARSVLNAKSMSKKDLRFQAHLTTNHIANTGKADDHLTNIEQEARRRMDTLLPQMMKADGVTEELKSRDQMAWVGLMNKCKSKA